MGFGDEEEDQVSDVGEEDEEVVKALTKDGTSVPSIDYRKLRRLGQ